jgi:cytochrome b
MPRPERTDSSPRPQGVPDNNDLTIRVWDPFVRLFHWGLVLSFGVAWLSSRSWEQLHDWAGYAAAALILSRAAWGIIGTRYSRFSQFVHSPRIVLDYLTAIARGNEARHIGHNPAGGAMVVTLMLAMGSTAFTGWMLTTDAFWGVTWMQKLHNLLAHGILILVCVHIAGVLLASFRHRENLIAAMIFGQKRAPESADSG